MKELHNSDWLYKRSAILSTYTPKNVIQRQKVLISYSCCSFQMSEQVTNFACVSCMFIMKC